MLSEILIQRVKKFVFTNFVVYFTKKFTIFTKITLQSLKNMLKYIHNPKKEIWR